MDEGADAATGHEVKTEVHQRAVPTQGWDAADAVGELSSLQSNSQGQSCRTNTQVDCR